MNLFKKNKSQTAVQTNVEPGAAAQAERKYFEVFGDTLGQLNFFKTLSLCLAALSIFLTILLRVSMRKTPVVIRVDQLGQAQGIQDASSSLAVSAPELSNFSQTFLQYFSGWNVYTYEEDFHRAFKMMTMNLRGKMNDYLNSNHVAENIRQDKLKVKVNISEITVEKDAPGTVILKVTGVREMRSYEKQDLQKEIIFEDTLTLQKVQRTMETPWGLLVENWSESLFKK